MISMYPLRWVDKIIECIGGINQSLLWVWVGASDLLDDHVYLVSVLHVQILGGLVLVESFSVEEEADVLGVELSG